MPVKRKLKLLIFNLLKLKLINFLFLALSSIVKAINIRPLSQFFFRFPLNRRIKVITPEGWRFFMKTDGSDGIATEIYWYGMESYENETISAFRELLSISKTFVDIGANTGIYSLLAASKGNNMQVHSFEPVQRVFK
jgi:hypothetical protein